MLRKWNGEFKNMNKVFCFTREHVLEDIISLSAAITALKLLVGLIMIQVFFKSFKFGLSCFYMLFLL